MTYKILNETVLVDKDYFFTMNTSYTPDPMDLRCIRNITGLQQDVSPFPNEL